MYLNSPQQQAPTCLEIFGMPHQEKWNNIPQYGWRTGCIYEKSISSCYKGARSSHWILKSKEFTLDIKKEIVPIFVQIIKTGKQKMREL